MKRVQCRVRSGPGAERTVGGCAAATAVAAVPRRPLRRLSQNRHAVCASKPATHKRRAPTWVVKVKRKRWAELSVSVWLDAGVARSTRT